MRSLFGRRRSAFGPADAKSHRRGTLFFNRSRKENASAGHPADLYPWGGGFDLATGGHGPVIYNCYLTNDQVWLLRVNPVVNVFVDVAPDVAHAYRLELHGAGSYAWLIDGQVVDSGVPIGDYPADDPVISWSARMGFVPNTSRCDYIRYGRISEFQPVLGDLNCDGAVNNFDIDPFVIALTDPGAYGEQFPSCRIENADVNADGSVNNFDIDPFVECLVAGGCP